jgi:endonuclease-3
MKEKVTSIIEILKKRYPQAPCALHYRKDYELMIAVRLSAQCTDARVNLVTPALFAAYPTLQAMATADISDVENYVHSCGFYKHKARDIVLACQMLLSEYDGKVPNTMEDLLKLPGVGRKTANLLLGDLYGVPGSIVCDTHCIRICGRLGMYPEKEKDPTKIEKILRELIDLKEGSDFCHRIVFFGREVCTARSPMCESCPLSDLCLKYEREHGKD